jgi:predicted O-methyltransferase YrrM
LVFLHHLIKSTFRKTSPIYKYLGLRARPEIGWLSRVLEIDPESVKEAINEIDKVKVLRDAEERICATILKTGKSYYAQFPAPLELYAAVRLTKPKIVVESGVSAGISTAHILMGLMRNGKGKLHSIDFPTKQEELGDGETCSWALPSAKSSGWAIPPSLKKRWELVIGQSEDKMAELLARLGRVDLFCHDSPVSKEHLAFELKTILPRFHSGSLVIADNTDQNPEAFQKAARKLGAQVFRRRSSSLAAFLVPT